jgi:hypothetical protein
MVKTCRKSGTGNGRKGKLHLLDREARERALFIFIRDQRQGVNPTVTVWIHVPLLNQKQEGYFCVPWGSLYPK